MKPGNMSYTAVSIHLKDCDHLREPKQIVRLSKSGTKVVPHSSVVVNYFTFNIML